MNIYAFVKGSWGGFKGSTFHRFAEGVSTFVLKNQENHVLLDLTGPCCFTGFHG